MSDARTTRPAGRGDGDVVANASGENPALDMLDTATGKLIVLSGPSGVGKTTVARQLLRSSDKPLAASVSATTRPPRLGEVDGRDYYFLTDEDFQAKRKADAFLECAEVFGRGHWYGTLLSEVEPKIVAGKWVVLEIDVQGAQRVKSKFPSAVTIFVQPESTAELERRLRGRGTEAEDVIQLRLDVARRELELARTYDYRVTNRTVDEAVAEILDILNRLEKST